ncbi:PEP-CTERM sorting domain-containing protein [Nitrogeniibacter aestuarii]|uniref:PEP-CTERM sorting domain-containing protein n=1 Tax=Nitrogeniibacter aestuarii TaxID=2815343 RepID=UPI001D115A06|nr:PEP-CTERM sorting domain-containing protein [Nitrogeniibacter aestuarii]
MKAKHLIALALASVAGAANANLIANGDFNAGLSGWTVQNGGSGAWYADAVGTATPFSNHQTSSAGGGAGTYAVTDQGGAGLHVMSQVFTVSANQQVTIEFDLFANSYGGNVIDCGVIAYNVGPCQYTMVDIVRASANPLSRSGGDVVATLLSPFVDPLSNPNPFTSYAFDVSAFLATGGDFRLRFAEVDNRGYLNVGVDNVSVLAQSTVPEPASIALIGLGLTGLMVSRRKKQS